MRKITVQDPNFDLMNNLIPAVIQDYETNEVLMVGYLNPEAWELTVSKGKMYYYSRKKKRIWLKGEQSGHYQIVKQIFLNCDNTCLLIKVNQIGGACDLGLKTCFDKILNENKFESTGVKVFDPKNVYGEKFTQQIVLGIPSGSLEQITFKLLELAGFEIKRLSSRSYRPIAINSPDLKFFMARAQELPFYVSKGLIDAAITGMDLIEEADISVRDVCDLSYNKLGLGPVILALSIPHETSIKKLEDLEGKQIATTYQNCTQRYFNERGISVKIVPSIGATEGKVPVIADAVVELVETGATLEANRLKPILKLYETTVHLIANNESWGYTWKRRKLENIANTLKVAAKNLPQSPKKNINLPADNSL